MPSGLWRVQIPLLHSGNVTYTSQLRDTFWGHGWMISWKQTTIFRHHKKLVLRVLASTAKTESLLLNTVGKHIEKCFTDKLIDRDLDRKQSFYCNLCFEMQGLSYMLHLFARKFGHVNKTAMSLKEIVKAILVFMYLHQVAPNITSEITVWVIFSRVKSDQCEL